MRSVSESWQERRGFFNTPDSRGERPLTLGPASLRPATGPGGAGTRDRRLGTGGLTSLFQPDHDGSMKPSFPLRLFSFLFMGGGALLLPACETGDGWRDGAARPTKVTKQRRGTPAPYYGMNAPGPRYPVSSEGRNSNYQAPIQRYDPNRRALAAPLEDERPKRWQPSTLKGTEFYD